MRDNGTRNSWRSADRDRVQGSRLVLSSFSLLFSPSLFSLSCRLFLSSRYKADFIWSSASCVNRSRLRCCGSCTATVGMQKSDVTCVWGTLLIGSGGLSLLYTRRCGRLSAAFWSAWSGVGMDGPSRRAASTQVCAARRARKIIIIHW